MDATAILQAILKLRDELTPGLRGVASIAKSTFSAMAGHVRTTAQSLFSLKNAIIGIVAGATVRDLVKSFAEAEQAGVIFSNALKLGGKFSAEYHAQLVALANTIEKTGTAEADAVLSASKLLAVHDKIGKETLPRAIQAGADLAAFLGTDLSSAMQMVAGAASGITGGLARYG